MQLKRGTMANWMVLTSNIYLRPFWVLFHAELLTQPVIHADETVLQVLKEAGRKPTDESRVWIYASGKRAAHQIRLFRYESSRAGACAEARLKGFRGVLVADGYSGCNLVSQVIRAGCWRTCGESGTRPCRRMPRRKTARPLSALSTAADFSRSRRSCRH